MESATYPSNRNLKKVITAAGAVTLAIGLSSCSNGTSSPESLSSSSNVSTAPTHLTPNMVGFLKPGTNNVCFNGGERPCAILIRTSPKLSGDIVNASPSQGRVNWPLEAFNGQTGDSLTVECYTPNGQAISAYEGNSSSSDWYEIAVPEQYVLNPSVQAELAKPNSPIKTIQLGGQTTVLGWASVEWFNQSSPVSTVPVCNS
jgi:hypothetical protein